MAGVVASVEPSAALAEATGMGVLGRRSSWLAMMALLAIGSLVAMGPQLRQRIWWWQRAPVALGALLLWVAMSTLWSHDPRTTAVVAFAMIAAATCGVLLVQGGRSRLVLAGLSAGIAAVTGLGLVLAAVGWAGATDDGATLAGFARASGLASEPGLYGFFAAVGVTAGLASLRPVGWMSAGVCLAGVAASQTFTAVAAVAIGFMVVLASSGLRGRLILAVALVTVGGWSLFAGVGWNDVGSVATARDGVYAKPESLNGRTDLWREHLRLAQSAPLVGIGAWATPEGFLVEGHVRSDNAHNLPLQVLVGTGLIGVGLAAYAATEAWRHGRGGVGSRNVLLVVLVATLGSPLADLPLLTLLVVGLVVGEGTRKE